MSLVFTNEKCTGCNKCVRSCPVLIAGEYYRFFKRKC